MYPNILVFQDTFQYTRAVPSSGGVTVTDNTKNLIVQGGWWHYFRRVPKHVADLDTRRFVKIATRVRYVDDPTAGKRAAKIADRLNEATEVYWAELLAGRHNEARQQLTLATKRAVQLGFTYQSAIEVAGLPAIEAILTRIEALGTGRADVDNKIDRIAILGSAVTASGIMISMLPEEYKNHCAVENRKKTEDQLRKWNNRNKAACNNLITAIGSDKDILLVDRADAKKFREWWARRITDEGMKNGGANKDIWGMGKMIRTICERDELKDPEAFARLGFEKDDGQRDAFEFDFVRDTIRNKANFNMNDDAFDAMLVMVETGARPSEIVALDKKHIHLAANIPYISVREEGREVKTKASIRDVPLVGCALEAMRRHPNGFERYFNRRADGVGQQAPAQAPARGQREGRRDLQDDVRHPPLLQGPAARGSRGRWHDGRPDGPRGGQRTGKQE